MSASQGVLGLDVGEAWVKRSILSGERAVAVADPSWGALRTPRLAASWEEGAAVLLTASSEALAATRQELKQRGVDVRGAIDPLVAIALAVRHEHPPAESTQREAVIDLGHRDVRLGLVRWCSVEGRDYPTLEAREVVSPLAGARLDDDLAYALKQPIEAVRELKELCTRTRGPWVREHAGVACELDALQGRTLLEEFSETWRVALPTLAAMLRERESGRILIAGGMARVPGVLEPLLEALASLGVPLVVADAPGFAAARGAAHAAAGAGSPLAPAVYAWEQRAGRVARCELCSGGELLPARFGPFAVQTAGATPLLIELGDDLRALDLQHTAQSFTLSWSFDDGWTAEVDGAALELRPASEAESAARETAQSFDWSSCGQAVDVDAVVLFRATAGGGRSHALVQGALPALLAPLGADARLRAVAVGDHPQAHLRPRFVTSAQPSWGGIDALSAFVGEVLSDPVEGIDLPDAFEIALQEACDFDWRPGATRVVLLLSDVPCHLPENPPYTQVRWQDAAERLQEAGAELVGVHVQGGGRPPSVLRSAREFLEAFDPGFVGLGGDAPPELVTRMSELAARRKPDPAGQGLIDALGGWTVQRQGRTGVHLIEPAGD